MVTGIVLVNVERHKLKNVVDAILRFESVTEVYAVAGEYDLVAIIRANDNQQLSTIVADKMPHEIDGITHTKTLIALKANSKFDLEKLFNIK
jgi:DNA-binding Lrp family transcriptional regulator